VSPPSCERVPSFSSLTRDSADGGLGHSGLTRDSGAAGKGYSELTRNSFFSVAACTCLELDAPCHSDEISSLMAEFEFDGY
jgi:hypothetical protein